MQETATGNFFRWSHSKSWYDSVFLSYIWFTHLISTTRLTGKEMFVSIHLHFTYVKWKADMTSLHARIRGQGKGTLAQNHARMQMFLDLLRALGSEARCARSRSRCWATGGASGVGFHSSRNGWVALGWCCFEVPRNIGCPTGQGGWRPILWHTYIWQSNNALRILIFKCLVFNSLFFPDYVRDSCAQNGIIEMGRE